MESASLRLFRPAVTLRRLAVAMGLIGCAGPGPALGAATGIVEFSRDIQPLLADRCFSCHGPDEAHRKGQLRLDTQAGALGSANGKAAVVPGNRSASELVRRIRSRDPEEQMPPPKANRPLTAAQIETFERWIDEGAPWTQHWSYGPVRRPALPAGRPEAAAWRENPVDRFIDDRLAREGLKPSAEADRRTLIRRLSLDLIGLPPTPEEVVQFQRDASPDAYGHLVDRLLASPRFGERWAWSWLEAARYADSNGYQGDGERTMWPWRDWVIDALNRDLPFDEFTTWQLAGDLLPGATHEQRLATGFLRNHMINGEGGRIPEENRIDYLFDQTETVATVWLGATFNCTRCHDHKFDPFTKQDYFSLLAYFDRTRVDGSGGDPQSPPNLEVPSSEQSSRRRELELQLEAAATLVQNAETALFLRGPGRPLEENSLAASLPGEVLKALQIPPNRRDAAQTSRIADHWKEGRPEYVQLLRVQRELLEQRGQLNRRIPKVMVMEDLSGPPPRVTRLLQRGLYNQPGAPVTAALPVSLSPGSTPPPDNRLGLARWLISPQNPTTARVTVNRLWQNLFGTGLVKTAEDFGAQGERPSHPELLDWLSSELMSSGWRMKPLLRQLVTSAAYRQSSHVTPALLERDPENRLLARGPRYRLPSWMIRDAALSVAGLLADKIGGPPVKPYQPTGIWEEATFGAKHYEPDHGEALYRRSLYVFWRRIVAPTMFFDVASRQTCTVKTPRTNVPLHALLTLNDVTYVEAARTLAQRILTGGDTSVAERLNRLFELVLSRPAAASEVALLSQSLARYQAAYATQPAAASELLKVGESAADPTLNSIELAAWTLLANTVLNLDESLTRE